MKQFWLTLALLGLSRLPTGLGQAPVKHPAALKDISVSNFKISVNDDVGSSNDWIEGAENVAYLGQASLLSATEDQRLHLSFLIRDSANVAQNPHQVFVRIASPSKEAFVVPQANSQSVYNLAVAPKSIADQLDNISGRYELSLIVGDAKLKPIRWTFGEIKLYFSGESVKTPDYYEKKPEIVHTFREPEKRPHVFVSNIFSLAIISLFGLMLLMWSRIGISLGNITTSSILFQLSLGVILYIEYLFYLGNNMFTTLRYLTWAAPFALFFGRRMLAQLSKIEEP